MRKAKLFLIGMASVLLAFGMMGCDDVVSGGKKAWTDETGSYTLVLNGAAANARYTAAVYDHKERVEAQNYAVWSGTAKTLGGGEADSTGSPASVKLATYSESAVFSDGPYLVKITEKTGTAETAKYSSAVPFSASSVTLNWSTMTVIPPAKTAEVGSVVYAGTTANGEPMELVITNAAPLNVSANVAGQPVFAYTPRTGDTYVIKVSGLVVSSGSVKVTAGAALEFSSEGFTFTATVSVGGLKFSGKITASLDGDSIPELTLTVEGNKEEAIGLTLKGTEAGVTYAVRVYPNPEDEVKDADAWTEATADGKLAAGGEAVAEGEEVLVSLTAPDGSRFAASGSFLVVVTTGEEARYAYAGTAFLDGSTVLELNYMMEPPNGEGGANGWSRYTLELNGVTSGISYEAQIYDSDGRYASRGYEVNATSETVKITLYPSTYEGSPRFFPDVSYVLQIESFVTIPGFKYTETREIRPFLFANAGGNTQLDWRNMTVISANTDEGAVGLTLKGTNTGAVYTVRAYKYGIDGFVAEGTATAEGIETVVSLTITPYGYRFKATGEYIVVIMEDGKTLYKALTFQNGNAVIPWGGFTSIADALAHLDSHADGNTVDNPVPLKMNINIASATDGWTALVNALASRNKYVALDLSACSMNDMETDWEFAPYPAIHPVYDTPRDSVLDSESGTEFDLYAGTVDGKKYIVSLVLPDSATSVVNSSEWIHEDPTTDETLSIVNSAYISSDYSSLKSVSGANITTGGGFYHCLALTTVSFPEAISIGAYTFQHCTSLTTVSIPKAMGIGYSAFIYSGTTPLTITMGAAAPTVGYDIFASVTAAKNVTVRVPNGASGYDATWQNAFKGYGNDGSEHGTVNNYINLQIVYY